MVCNLPNYISNKYAGILTKEDVGQLFDKLTEILGNRSEATRQCGLTGKATYDWEKAAYLKLATKRKVLEACLKINFLNTIKYLLTRSSERTTDVLRTILSFMYAEAIETMSKELFIQLITEFVSLRKEYCGLINDRISDEVTDMLLMLRQKALELEVPVPKKSINEIPTKEFLDVVPLIAEMYLNNPQEITHIADTLDLPLESVKTLLPTFKRLQHSGGIITPMIETSEPNNLLEWWKWVDNHSVNIGIGAVPPQQTLKLICRDKTMKDSEKKKATLTIGTFSEEGIKIWPRHTKCTNNYALGGDF